VKRSTRILGLLSALLSVGLLSQPFEAKAVNVYESSLTAARQTNVESQAAWKYQAQWGGALATPIDSTHFLVAKHIFSNLTPTSLPDVLSFGGIDYTVDKTSVVKDRYSDLAVVKIKSGKFSTFAPLYTDTNEYGKEITIFGKGRVPGSPVYVGDDLRGWTWAGWSSAPSWGKNLVSGLAINGAYPHEDYLTFDFTPTQQIPHPAGLAEGDSSGGVFINDGGVWKLAGVNYSLDSWKYWSLTATGPQFGADLIDGQGLYYEGNLVTGHDATTSYATRVSSRVDWIRSVTVPEPAAVAMIVGIVPLALLVFWRRRRGT
jgi:hypothetical protein